MATNNQMRDHITRVREAASSLLDAIDKLDALRTEWDYAALGSTMPTDLAALGHDGLARDDIAAAYTTAAAVRSLLDSGHGTNLVKVKA